MRMHPDARWALYAGVPLAAGMTLVGAAGVAVLALAGPMVAGAALTTALTIEALATPGR